jgi:threonine synthase
VNYISTRGGDEHQPLAALLTRGTASDGGLFVPRQWPLVSPANSEALLHGEYADIASRVLQIFDDGSLPQALIDQAVHRAMNSFQAPVGPPVTSMGDALWALELMHGPTLAFKDFALAPLAEIIDSQLEVENKTATVLCATSGDTGAATVSAFANRERINAVVLFPDGGVSDFQRKQMTTTGADNVLPLCVAGDFDDCQRTVKQLYQTDAAQRYGYTAVNSINIVRILLQTAYYLRTSGIINNDTREAVNFIVPTGNFGNVYAAYIAKQLGAPIDKLVISSNDNDVLPRLFDTGRMQGRKTVKTISPSMDIQVSSNFERLLWHIKQHNTAAVEQAQDELERAKGYDLSDSEMRFLAQDFLAHRCTEEDALSTMQLVWQQHEKIICPHTATAFHAVSKRSDRLSGQTVVVETAHPAKFSDAVQQATGVKPAIPDHVKNQFTQPESFVHVSPAEVQSAIDSKFGSAL